MQTIWANFYSGKLKNKSISFKTAYVFSPLKVSKTNRLKNSTIIREYKNNGFFSIIQGIEKSIKAMTTTASENTTVIIHQVKSLTSFVSYSTLTGLSATAIDNTMTSGTFRTSTERILSSLGPNFSTTPIIRAFPST